MDTERALVQSLQIFPKRNALRGFPQNTVELDIDEGINGDARSGRLMELDLQTTVLSFNQLIAISLEELKARNGGKTRGINADLLGAHIALTGSVCLEHLPRGSKLVFEQGPILVVTGHSGLGLNLAVEVGGKITRGDEVIIRHHLILPAIL